MSKRRKTGSITRMVAYIAAGIVHAVIIGALLFNYTVKTKTVDALDAEKVSIVQATTIDESQIKEQENKLKKLDRDKKLKEKRERERLEKLKLDAEQEKKNIEKLKDKQKEELAKAAELEKQRKAIALKKQKEEDQRKKDLEARKKQEALEKARKKKLEDERKAQEYEAQQALNKLLEQEETLRAQQDADRRAKERTASLLAIYSARIKNAIGAKRIIAPDFETWRVTRLNIKTSPRGDVLSVSIVESSGSERYDRSAEAAIRQASPLPIPSPEEDANAHNTFRDFIFKFKMPGAR